MKRYPKILILFLFFFLTICGTSKTQETKEINWLKNNAFVFETAEAGHGFQDLEPLKEIIGNARIVGLGEGTRGEPDRDKSNLALEAFLKKGRQLGGRPLGFRECRGNRGRSRAGRGRVRKSRLLCRRRAGP